MVIVFEFVNQLEKQLYFPLRYIYKKNYEIILKILSCCLN